MKVRSKVNRERHVSSRRRRKPRKPRYRWAVYVGRELVREGIEFSREEADKKAKKVEKKYKKRESNK